MEMEVPTTHAPEALRQRELLEQLPLDSAQRASIEQTLAGEHGPQAVACLKEAEDALAELARLNEKMRPVWASIDQQAEEKAEMIRPTLLDEMEIDRAVVHNVLQEEVRRAREDLDKAAAEVRAMIDSAMVEADPVKARESIRKVIGEALAEERAPSREGFTHNTYIRAALTKGNYKCFEVHLIGHDRKKVLAESFYITEAEPREVHFKGSESQIVYYLHALSQPVHEVAVGEDSASAQAWYVP